MNQSLYQKYRSKTFAEIIGQDKIVKTLQNALKSGQIGHAYLFAGQRGTGKTSIARILARCVNCQQAGEGQTEPCLTCDFCLAFGKNQVMDVIEIDAASNRGIDEIRDLREKIKFAPTASKYKIYIIDEVHMLTREAFNALLKTLEEPPKHVIFILATTEAHKLPATILSRVQRFDFRRVAIPDIQKNLRKIADQEKIEIDDEALRLIAAKAEGSHRDAISLLEQIKSYATKISIKEVEEVLGVANQELCFNLLLDMEAGKRREVLTQIENYAGAGFDLSQLALGLADSLRQVLVSKSGAKELVIIGREFEKDVEKLSEITASELILAVEVFLQAAKETKTTEIVTLPVVLAASKVIEEWTGDQSQKSKEENQDSLTVSSSGRQRHDPGIQDDKKPPALPADKSSSGEIHSIDPSTTVGMTKEVVTDTSFWSEVVEKSKKHNHSLHALLRDIKPVGINGEKLVVRAKFKFHLDKISEAKNKRLLEGIIEEVTGKKLVIAGELADKSNAKKKPASDDDLAKAAEEVFG